VVVWRIVDGKPGHESQTAGLLAALRRIRPVDEYRVEAPRSLRASLARMWHGDPAAQARPDPHLILAAGHATHLTALRLRRSRGGRVIVLMRPTWPIHWFDLCLVPEHDLRPVRDRMSAPQLVVTCGVLNPVLPASCPSPTTGLVLIGGPSRHHDWHEESVVAQVGRLARAADHIHWSLTTSRRTPHSTLVRLQSSAPANVSVVPGTQTAPGWVARQMQSAGVIFVTEDSVSMIYEAITSGADVGLLTVPRRRTGRVARGVDRLVEERRVVPFPVWTDRGFADRTRRPLQEAERCAGLIVERFLDAA
jgi:hypothetical protein